MEEGKDEGEEEKSGEDEKPQEEVEEEKPEPEPGNNEEKESFISKIKEKPWQVTTAVLGVACLILLVLALKPGITGNVIAGDSAGDKLVEYLNTQVGGGVQYVSYQDLGNIYQVNVLYEGDNVPVYITKDGGYFIQSASPLSGQPGVQPTPTPTPTQPTTIVDVSEDDDAVKGDSNAKVTIIEFSDYECPFCGRHFTQTLPQIISEYVDTGKVRIVYRDFPLGFHQNAQKAAEATECVGEEGDNKYWEYHDILFNNQNALDVASLKKYAGEVGVDIEKFNNCLDSGQMTSEVQKDMADGQAAGVSGTPGFLINGRLVSGAQPFSAFKQIIDEELAK
tara:strand:+ start:1120 stop:2127 length:1008 start_codon:yes stop_codon:yes gene_type:complete